MVDLERLYDIPGREYKNFFDTIYCLWVAGFSGDPFLCFVIFIVW